MTDLKGERVLITGAANGLGRCLAELFADERCVLALTDIDKDALDQTAGRLKEQAADIRTFVLDVSEQERVEEMAAKVLADLGGIDILICNAGIGVHGELAQTSLETWKKVMDVDFWGALYHVYAFLPSMIRAGGGHIVNISSGQAFYRMPTWGAYSIVKLAQGAFSELLGIEVRKFGIRVTTVYPFMIDTQGFYQDFAPETIAAKLSLKVQPYFSMSPQRMARKILRAVKSNKRIEMTSIFNTLGFYSRLAPPLSGLFSAATIKVLGESPGKMRDSMPT